MKKKFPLLVTGLVTALMLMALTSLFAQPADVSGADPLALPTVTAPPQEPTPDCFPDCGIWLPWAIRKVVPPKPEEPCSVYSWADPRYKKCIKGTINADGWKTGVFTSTANSFPDGEYTIELTGSTDPEHKRVRSADSAAVIQGEKELVYTFSQFNYEEDDRNYTSPVFHNRAYWTGDSTLILPNLGSLEPKDDNDEPLTMIVEGDDAQTLVWDESKVGEQITLADGTLIVVSQFTDYYETPMPAFAIRRGCLGLIAVRETTGYYVMPESAKLVLVVLPDCGEDETMTGFLAPLIQGGDVPGDPNEFKRPSRFPVSASADQEVQLVLRKIED